MTEQPITRRLAAVLAADISGYGIMMGTDEIGTVAALRQIWAQSGQHLRSVEAESTKAKRIRAMRHQVRSRRNVGDESFAVFVDANVDTAEPLQLKRLHSLRCNATERCT